jgi:hypothetical protein
MRSFRSLFLFLLLAPFAATPAAAVVTGCGANECTPGRGCKILLCTSLDNVAETLVPDLGPTASGLTTSDFVEGVIDRGVRANSVGEYAAYPQIGVDPQGATVQSIENSQGTLDFWYQPFYDETDPSEYFIITNADRRVVSGKVVPKPSSLEILKHSSLGNGNALAINYWDGVATETLPGGLVIPKRWEFWISPNHYELRFAQFTNFRITWNWSSTGVPLRVWQDGVELPLERADGGPAWTGPMGVAPESSNEALFICGRPSGTGGPLFQYNGVCDEVRVFDRPIPHPGSSPVPTVSCGLGPELAAILPVLAWARTRRRRANA